MTTKLIANSTPTAQDQSDRAYRMLREAILLGQFKPGERLNERSICEMLNLSRTPLRHAFARLRSEGLVEEVRYAGCFVRKMTISEAVSLVEVRQVLEAGAAALAAQRATEPDRNSLLETAREADEARIKAPDQGLIREEMHFHREVVRLTYNSELARIFDNVHALFLTLQPEGRTHRRPNPTTHEMIAEAIASRNPMEAYRRMWEHLTLCLDTWMHTEVRRDEREEGVQPPRAPDGEPVAILDSSWARLARVTKMSDPSAGTTSYQTERQG